MTIQDLRDKGLMLFEVISGSRAYGTHKPMSDFDYRGVYILPQENLYGFNYIEQVSDATNDSVYYEIGRFLQLLQAQNPNIIELFNIPEENIIYKHPLFDEILKHKGDFISKVCRDSFGGYAVAQIQKARGLNKKIVNPMPKERKGILDFCHVIDGCDTVSLKTFLSVNGYDQKYCGLVNVPHARDVYALFYDDHQISLGYRGIENEDGTSNEVRLSSIPKGETPIATMIYNKDGYTKYCKDYKEYWDWEEKKNQHRYNTNMEHGKGYDCYLESETEFLTYNGWKKYDEVTHNDYIGTINPETLLVEWQQYTNRIKDSYSGDIFTFENRYTKFSVTGNHKLFVANTARSLKNGFKTSRSSDFYFETVNDFFTNKKSYKHILINAPGSTHGGIVISNELLILIGLYISEGSLIKNEKGLVKGISLSQVKDGRFRELISLIRDKYNIHEYTHERKGRLETTYNIYDTKLADIIKNECGEYCRNKTLPSYYLSLSNEQVDILLDALVSGDGHIHKKGHTVYYSNSGVLVDQLHTLLTLNGYNTQFYPYVSTKQLFISKQKKQTQCINKNNKRVFGWTKRIVDNENIVCFEVPNSILITRNANKMAFHGNSKNMMHCIRLVRMATEIAEQKKVMVKRPDAAELMLIRNGEMEYEALLLEAETKIKLLDELYANSDLPNKIDKDFVNRMLIDFRIKYYETRKS